MSHRIGIALAAFQPNPEFFLKQLESIKSQTFTDWECWIGFDSPLKPIREDARFERFFQDKRFHWDENAKNLGHLKNFEHAIQSVLTLGVDSIACSDQDDIWYPEKLELSLEELKATGKLGLVFCDMYLMDSLGADSGKTAWEVEKRGVDHCGTFDFLIRNVVPGTGMLMDAQLAKRFPVIPPEAGFHDRWYPLIASRFGKVVPLRKPLYSYRIHAENVAGATPFKGLFVRSQNQKAGLKGIVEKCVGVWQESHALAQTAEQKGISLSVFQKAAFIWPWDFGLVLGLYGFLRVLDDPALARASWARAVGKFLVELRVAKRLSR